LIGQLQPGPVHLCKEKLLLPRGLPRGFRDLAKLLSGLAGLLGRLAALIVQLALFFCPLSQTFMQLPRCLCCRRSGLLRLAECFRSNPCLFADFPLFLLVLALPFSLLSMPLGSITLSFSVGMPGVVWLCRHLGGHG
jgi:hypothetical protein